MKGQNMKRLVFLCCFSLAACNPDQGPKGSPDLGQPTPQSSNQSKKESCTEISQRLLAMGTETTATNLLQELAKPFDQKQNRVLDLDQLAECLDQSLNINCDSLTCKIEEKIK